MVSCEIHGTAGLSKLQLGFAYRRGTIDHNFLSAIILLEAALPSVGESVVFQPMIQWLMFERTMQCS
jgi:hypothetical protein